MVAIVPLWFGLTLNGDVSVADKASCASCNGLCNNNNAPTCVNKLRSRIPNKMAMLLYYVPKLREVQHMFVLSICRIDRHFR